MTQEDVRHLREAAQVLLMLFRCVSMKRALDAANGPKLSFFYLYDSCLMDVAVISWCKLFGSEKEKLYWTRLPDLPEQQFLKVEFDHALKDQHSLDALSLSVRNYRDTYVAHHDLNETKRAKAHPLLDPVRATGIVLYRRIYQALRRENCHNGLTVADEHFEASLNDQELHWHNIIDAAKTVVKDFSDFPTG